MKIISITGPTQSGSTMLFNLVRLCIIRMGYSVDSCFIVNYYAGDYNKTVDYLIIKCHSFDDRILKDSSKILLPIRDVRDCAVSWKKRFLPTETPTAEQYIHGIILNIEMFDTWKARGAIVLKYEEYVMNKFQYIKNVINILGFDPSRINIQDIIRELEMIHAGVNCPETDVLGEQGHKNLMFNNIVYRTTLMTKSHNTSGGRIKNYLRDMPPDVLKSVNSNPNIIKHLRENGYDI